MHAHARILGHPIHQMLIVFPLGLLGMATIFDILRLVWENPTLSICACWMMAAGIITGLVAAVFGAIDWWAIPIHTRAKTIGLIHGVTMVLAVVIYAASFLLRYRHAADLNETAIGVSILGLVVASIGGWFGGELVDRMGVGVEEGANPNSPGPFSVTVHSEQGPRP